MTSLWGFGHEKVLDYKRKFLPQYLWRGRQWFTTFDTELYGAEINCLAFQENQTGSCLEGLWTTTWNGFWCRTAFWCTTDGWILDLLYFGLTNTTGEPTFSKAFPLSGLAVWQTVKLRHQFRSNGAQQKKLSGCLRAPVASLRIGSGRRLWPGLNW
jgi:hypothetical protein